MKHSIFIFLSFLLCTCLSAVSASVIVNELNAVSATQALEGGGGDSQLGRVIGNGGDWFELVVVGTGAGSTVDMRGWQLEIKRQVALPFTPDDVIVLSNNSYWMNVPAGTILTFTESRTAEGGMDTSLNAVDRRATEGWAHSNIWIGDATLITFTDEATNGYTLDPVAGVSGVNLNDVDTQIRVKDDLGAFVFGPAGEGVKPADNEISDQEVFMLQQTPGTSVTPTSHYGDSSDEDDHIAYSTFGHPNQWFAAGETFTQSFSGFLSGGAPPVFHSSQESVNLLSGDPFSYSIQAFDANGDSLVLSVVQGPGFLGLTDNENGTGQLTGTPTIAQAGSYVVKLQVSDNNNGTHQQAFTLNVLPRTAEVIVNEYNAVSSTAVLSEDWSFDQRLDLVMGNGGDWVELVVVGNGTAGSTVDMRGWCIEVTEDGLPAGSITLSSDAAWQSVQAGTILTFTESDTANGGMDTQWLAENRLAVEGWAWSNVYVGDLTLINQAMSDGKISVSARGTQIALYNGTGNLVAGPYGEGVFSAKSINNTEVFRLSSDPSPLIHPLSPGLSDADTSTFGHPNRKPEGDGTVAGQPIGAGNGYQSFKVFATGAASVAPYFTNLWGTRGTNNTLLGSNWSVPAITALDPDHAAGSLSFSLVAPPSGLSLVDNGGGAASLSWIPTTGQVGIHNLKIKVSDPSGAFLIRPLQVVVMPLSSAVLVNEYNAVGSSRFLNGGTLGEDKDGGTAGDSFFGRIAGNGGDWIELVVVGNGTAGSTVDMRGWQISISQNSSQPETIVLSQHPYFSAVQVGTILTFVENDALHGGLDSGIHRVNRFQDLGYGWTNIVITDETYVDQLASTVGRSISVNDFNTEITIKNAGGGVINGPVGEPRITRNVNAEETFHMEKTPAPVITSSVADSGFPNYADNNESSSFGSPNLWIMDVGGVPTNTGQSFLAFQSASNTNSIPVFTQLPAFLYGIAGRTTSQPVKANDFNGNPGLSLSLVNSPGWVSLVDNGNGEGTLDWTPSAGVTGLQEISVVVTDGVDTTTRTFSIFVHKTTAPVILNEYNAVSVSSFLNGGTVIADSVGGSASDQHFGRVAGNGRDWFELVVVGDDMPGELDMRGWKIEVAADANVPFVPKAVIELSNDAFWASVPHGSILTFTEERTAEGGLDTSIFMADHRGTAGWAWSNLWIGDPQYFTYTSALGNGYTIDPGSGAVPNLDVTSILTQFVVRDTAGNLVYGPAGEGVAPTSGIESQNVWELVGHPRSTVTPYDVADLVAPAFGAAASIAESTFGHPNRWSSSSVLQDFSVFSGPYESYVSTAGLVGLDSLMSADPDGDLFTNAQEFAHGTLSNDPASQPWFQPSASATTSFTLIRRAGGSMTNGIYSFDGFLMEVEYSTDLVSWHTATLQGVVPAGLPTPPPGYEYASIKLPSSVLTSSDRAFMRIHLTYP